MTTARTAAPIDLSKAGPNPATDGKAETENERAILAEYLAADNLDDLIPSSARDGVRFSESGRLP